MIRISLAHPQLFFLKLIQSTIEQRPDMCIAGQSTCLHSIINPLAESEVLLLSTAFPQEKLHSFLKARSQQQPRLKILMLGMTTDVNQIIEFVERGAFGYVLQDESAETMLTKIKAAHIEKPIFSSEVVGALLHRVQVVAGNSYTPSFDMPTPHKRLTPREIEVLQLIKNQMTNREIAKTLFIEEGTVKNHVHRILKKLNVSNRHEAVAYLKWMDVRSVS